MFIMQSPYREIKGWEAADEPAVQRWELPAVVVEKKEGATWKQHLYCDTEGEVHAKLNGWGKGAVRRRNEKA